jgi:hypothetical protein
MFDLEDWNRETHMFDGDAELLEPQRAGLEQPLEISAHCLLQLGGVRLHALPDPVQELHHADLGCARAGVELCSAKRSKGLGDQRGGRRTLVGLGVEGPRRSSGAGVEEEAAHMGEGSHGGKKRVFGTRGLRIEWAYDFGWPVWASKRGPRLLQV